MMRALLVKLAGLALYIHEPQPGRLRLTHQRPGRDSKEYTLDDEDFEDSADNLNYDDVAKLEIGLAASAVGLSLRVMKNDGVFKINYEGNIGGPADWTLEGMEALTGSNTAATAFTQTESDASPCLRCVEATKPQHSNSSIQAMSVSPVEMQALEPIRMTFAATLSTSTQTLEPGTEHAEKQQVSATLSIEAEEGNDLKCKAIEHIKVRPQKRAKSQHDSPPWPRHLYMTCFRTTPIFKGETGTLHVDVQAGTVWFEGWYGKVNARIFEKKQIDLTDTTTRVAYLLYDDISSFGRRTGIDDSTHYLNICKLTAKNDTTHLFAADCSVPGWRTWGSNMDTTPGPVHATRAVRRGKPDPRMPTTPPDVPKCPPATATPMTDPSIIVDAIVHCIDRASKRQAVHDPETDHQLKMYLENFSSFQEDRSWTQEGMQRWEFTVEEMKMREARRKMLRVVELKAI